MGALQNVKID